MINNNKELWEAMMGGPVEITEEAAKTAVEKAVFKSPECGCSFISDSAGVSLTGYAEGSDTALNPKVLFWGFTYDEFKTTMAEADAEGVAEWHIANGE
tara:strand:+ start:393 stop:686 length:294 start_codon:yes stop_codon:yes gene_type:complete